MVQQNQKLISNLLKDYKDSDFINKAILSLTNSFLLNGNSKYNEDWFSLEDLFPTLEDLADRLLTLELNGLIIKSISVFWTEQGGNVFWSFTFESLSLSRSTKHLKTKEQILEARNTTATLLSNFAYHFSDGDASNVRIQDIELEYTTIFTLNFIV